MKITCTRVEQLMHCWGFSVRTATNGHSTVGLRMKHPTKFSAISKEMVEGIDSELVTLNTL